tara:strand:+ start:2040 stop:2330 length:291 start_codon:yes stop_codon:yes gene_type:complete
VSNWKHNTTYFDQRPGSSWFEEKERRTEMLMQNALHKAESKSTDAQLCRLPEPELYECANCGKTGTESMIEEAKRKCGTGYGEWYCRSGFGCQADR